jgi:hypothetical protein
MKNFFFLFIFCFFLTNFLFAQSVLYVSSFATGANNGSSWTNAFSNLQNALVSAQYGDTIKVAQGKYKPTQDTKRDSAFHLPNGVKLLGGYAGNAATPNLRNWNTYQTILSGDIGVLDDDTDNSYHVIESYQLDSTSILEGFVVEKGRADNPMNGNERVGGGVFMYGFLDSDIQPTIQHCIFRDNYAQYGGALYLYGAYYNSRFNPLIQFCRFEDNQLYTGNTVYIKYRSEGDSATFRHCVFIENEARSLFLFAENVDFLRIESDTFIRNNAQLGLVVEIFGGFQNTTDLEINNCYFEQNKGDSGLQIGGFKNVLSKNMTFYNNETNNDVYFSPSGLLNLSAYTFKNAPFAGIRIDVNRFDCDKFIFDSIGKFDLLFFGRTITNQQTKIADKEVLQIVFFQIAVYLRELMLHHPTIRHWILF